MEHIYNYFYKITNLINGKFYYGIHSTNNLNDNYMGSGIRLHKAYNKYGIENFKKEILKYFDTFEELCNYEKEIVTEELVNDNNCYNMIVGGYYLTGDSLEKLKQTFAEKCHQQGDKNSQYGKTWITNDIVSKSVTSDELNYYLNNGWHIGRVIKNTENIKNANKDCCWVCKEGERSLHIKLNKLDEYLSQGYVRGRSWDAYIKALNKKLQPKEQRHVIAYNENNERVVITKSEYKTGKYTHVNKGMVCVKDKQNNIIGWVKRDNPKLLSGEYILISKNKISVKDYEGNTFSVDSNDPRYLSGELVGVNKGKHWKQKKLNKASIVLMKVTSYLC